MSDDNLDVVPLPKVEHPRSSLDGVSMMGIDTDPEANAQLAAVNADAQGLRIVTIAPYTTRWGRKAYLVITQEPPFGEELPVTAGEDQLAARRIRHARWLIDRALIRSTPPMMGQSLEAIKQALGELGGDYRAGEEQAFVLAEGQR